MNKFYRKGYYYERRAKQFLISEGYLVWRSPGSKSPIDIIAINDKGFVRLIQVKSHTNIRKEELENLKKLAKQYQKVQNVEIELWIFNKGELTIYNKKALLNL
ncbi:MAG: holliday junction resolvase [Nanoarchaeotal virus 1]|nr:MAG: holliday junction resolvase [Nanoarchaeotal virus 1]